MTTELQSKTKEKSIQRLKNIPYNSGIALFKKLQENGANLFGGMGEMGSKAYSTLLRAGIPTSMQDIDPVGTRKSQLDTMTTLEKGAKRKQISPEQVELIRKKHLLRDAVVFPNGGHISFKEIEIAHKESVEKAKALVSNFLDNVLGKDTHLRNEYSNVMFVLEAGPENLSFKQSVFEFFELALNSKNAILATNTSSLRVEDIAGKLEFKDRVVGFHYFLPAHVNPLIEIIATPETKEEIVQAMIHLSCAMHKKPIICRGDSPGAIANRILVGVLNEAAKIYDEGLGSIDEIDRIFLETFYEKQIKIKAKRAQNQFKAAPKLSFFNDEISLYEKIAECDNELKEVSEEKKEKILARKFKYLEEAEGKLRQKVLYATIVENHASLGSFFTPAPVVAGMKEKAKNQVEFIKKYLQGVKIDWDKLNEKFQISHYDLPCPEIKTQEKNNECLIKNRFYGAYLAIAFEIFNLGFADIQDIELACKEGFKWNVGPFELAHRFGINKSKELVSLVNENLSGQTGIANEENIFDVFELSLSGIRSYVQDKIGFIEIGKLHIQQLQMMQNSLSPITLKAISAALKELEENKNVQSIFFKSQGGGPFSAGADLSYFEKINWNFKDAKEYINLGFNLMDEIENCKKPTVCIIDGPAIGGGGELALACDYRIMTDLAYAAFPEVALGIIPRWGGTLRLPKIIGKKLAEILICTATLDKKGFKLGAKLTPQEALEVGFADKILIQSELPIFLGDLIENKISGLNIYEKPSQKNNFEKSDYSENIKKKYKFTKPEPFRFFTKYACELARNQIYKSHDTNAALKTNDDRKLMSSGKNVLDLYVNILIWAVQNKYIVRFLEMLKLA